MEVKPPPDLASQQLEFRCTNMTVYTCWSNFMIQLFLEGQIQVCDIWYLGVLLSKEEEHYPKEESDTKE